MCKVAGLILAASLVSHQKGKPFCSPSGQLAGRYKKAVVRLILFPIKNGGHSDSIVFVITVPIIFILTIAQFIIS